MLKLNGSCSSNFYLLIFLAFYGSWVSAQKPIYTNGHNSWNPDTLGNHRAIVQFNGYGPVAKVVIPWRRRDFNPEQKRIIVQDAKTKAKILNVKTDEITRESGTVYFEPISGKGLYYIYYMPYKDEGPNSFYPKGKYLIPENTFKDTWASIIATAPNIALSTAVKELQSINAFNSFYPMEVIATTAETTALLHQNKDHAFLVFPEDRMHAIRMKNDLPLRWITRGVKNTFTDQGLRGEFLAFQLGVYAIQDLQNVKISFSDLSNKTGQKIPSSQLSCINTDGIEYDGSPWSSQVNVSKNNVQPMWCGVDIPPSAIPGTYTGKAIVRAGTDTIEIALAILVRSNLTNNGGIDSPEKMTRLKWLNSALAQENTVISPYTKLSITDTVISFLGRKLFLGHDGLPAQIQTFFTPEMTSIGPIANNILAGPMHFNVEIEPGNAEKSWGNSGIQFLKKEEGTVSWKSVNTSEALEMTVTGNLEFDGFLAYQVKIKALRDVTCSDINFNMPIKSSAAKYFMGLGLKGGARPDEIHWTWDVPHKNQDGAWIGNVNAGLQFSFRDQHYIRPLNTNFYLQKPLVLPSSWGNSNKGGMNITSQENTVLVQAFSGNRIMKKEDELFYNFNLLITPFHPINTDFQWDSRFYHAYKPIDTIHTTGATVINIHHANAINPYINYPFIEHQKMKAYIDEAHRKHMKVKIYNTIRELSNKAYEIHALRSLGHEIFSSGQGGGFSWLQEHLGDDYIAAWFVPELKDAAIVNSGMNRWHNYYVEGMNWLTQRVGIDGVYLDDVAFDRVTMKRIKRVLTQNGKPGILDLHSANQFNKRDGFNNSANLYMEHFPYLNKLWFGEYFDYEKSLSDFYLTEVSGIPFGLMGEMLQDGGNAWRGMIYGMTNRLPWSDKADPRPIWKVWDEFGMKNSEMIGYWSENCPVKTTNDKVLATVYKKHGTALIAIASWADTDVAVQLKIDWKKLGIDPAQVKIRAPSIENFQKAQTFSKEDFLPIAQGKGWLLLIK